MNVQQLRDYIKKDFKTRENEDERILQAINDSIMAVSIQQPVGNYKYQSYVTTTIGQEDYPVPSNILHLIHPVRLLEGNDSNDGGKSLKRISKEQYDVMEPNPNRTDPSTGKPHSYTVYSRSILLTNIPDRADYLIEINWSKVPVELVADTDLHELGTEWDEVLKWMSLDRCFAGISMYEESSFFRYKYEDQEGRPIGIYKALLDKERGYEGRTLGQVQNNNL